MASAHIWLELLSYVKALFEAITLGADIREQYKKHRRERDTLVEANRVSDVFSTFSDQEVQAILERLKACQDRFTKEGDGAAEDVVSVRYSKMWLTGMKGHSHQLMTGRTSISS